MKIKIFFLISAMNALSYSGYWDCCGDCCEDCLGSKESEENKNKKGEKKDENEKSEEDENNESNESNENIENIPIDVEDNANNNKDYHNVSLKIEKFSDITTDGITLSGSNLDDMDGNYIHWGIIGEKGVGKTFLFKKICGIESDISNVEQGVLTFRLIKIYV